MNKPPIRFVVFRYSHHSPHSGYSRLAEYGVKHFDGSIIRVEKPLSKLIIRDRMLWALAKGTPGYDRSSMAAELQVAWHILREKNYLYHFLYGETTYHYAGKLNHYQNNRIIATFHLPPAGIQNSVQVNWHVQQLSAIVCVGRNQQEYFSKFYDRERTYFVPLGVDVEYYTPPASFETRDPNLCLVVGENYRDYPTLRGVIELVSYLRPQTKFMIIAPQRAANMIGQHPNLTIKSGISEAEFMNLYQTAALMVMPLQDTTANNAILESMACGLPVVASDVGAIRDYVDPDSTALVPPNNARAMAETVLGLLDAPTERARMANKTREHALKYSWFEVMKQLEKVYAEVA
jgi:glycosyltransferase involved in cell wall biosynthesis